MRFAYSPTQAYTCNSKLQCSILVRHKVMHSIEMATKKPNIERMTIDVFFWAEVLTRGAADVVKTAGAG